MTLVALDPGVTTGVAIHTGEGWSTNGGDRPSMYYTLVIHKSTDLWEILQHHNPEVVIFEDFNSAGLIDKNGQATLRLIGAIEAITYKLNVPTCLQFPRERYPFIPIARNMIRSMNKKYLVHEIDALSHLLLYEDRVERGVLDQIMAKRRTNKVKVNHEV